MSEESDRYFQFYRETKRSFERKLMMANYEKNIDALVQIEKVDEYGVFQPSTKDLRELDEVMFEQAMSLENIRRDIGKNLYAEDGTLRQQDLQLYLQVMRQFSAIYDKQNMTMARRYLVNR